MVVVDNLGNAIIGTTSDAVSLDGGSLYASLVDLLGTLEQLAEQHRSAEHTPETQMVDGLRRLTDHGMRQVIQHDAAREAYSDAAYTLRRILTAHSVIGYGDTET